MLRWQKLRLAADLRIGDVQALEFPDARFDTVVCTLSLCTISDGRQAMAEVCPVLRPGGQLLLLEHVRSPRPIVRFIERLVEPVTMRIDCDHLLSDGSTIFAELGFTVRRVERAKQGILEWVVARKPEPAGAGSVPHGIRGGPRNERAQTRAGAGCSGLGCGSCQRRAGHGNPMASGRSIGRSRSGLHGRRSSAASGSGAIARRGGSSGTKWTTWSATHGTATTSFASTSQTSRHSAAA